MSCSRIININEGRNTAIVQRCRKLWEYSAFIARVRDFERDLGSREEGIKAAIKHCLEQGILKEFLEEHSSEVFNMLLTEWNTADAIAVNRREGREEGLEEGLERGLEKGLERGREGGRKEIAKNLKVAGSSPDFIANVTGLTLEEIAEL